MRCELWYGSHQLLVAALNSLKTTQPECVHSEQMLQIVLPGELRNSNRWLSQVSFRFPDIHQYDLAVTDKGNSNSKYHNSKRWKIPESMVSAASLRCIGISRHTIFPQCKDNLACHYANRSIINCSVTYKHYKWARQLYSIPISITEGSITAGFR